MINESKRSSAENYRLDGVINSNAKTEGINHFLSSSSRLLTSNPKKIIIDMYLFLFDKYHQRYYTLKVASVMVFQKQFSSQAMKKEHSHAVLSF